MTDDRMAAFVRITLTECAMKFVARALALLAACEAEPDLPEPVLAEAQAFRRVVSAEGW